MRVQPLLVSDGRVAIPRCGVARDPLSRFLGLMFRGGLPAEEGLLFPKCNSIHTCFMRFPIDVVFLSPEGEVIDVVPKLRPWRLLLPRKRARHVLELSPGRASELGIAIGARLHCEGVWP